MFQVELNGQFILRVDTFDKAMQWLVAKAAEYTSVMWSPHDALALIYMQVTPKLVYRLFKIRM